MSISCRESTRQDVIFNKFTNFKLKIIIIYYFLITNYKSDENFHNLKFIISWI